MTLRTRLALFIAVAVGLTVAIVALFAYGFANAEARDEVDRFLRERGPVAGLLGALDLEDIGVGPGRGQGPGQGPAQGSGGGTVREPLADVVREDAVAQFVQRDGSIVAFNDSEIVLPVGEADIALARGPGPDVLRDVEVDGTHYRMLTRHIGPGLAIQVARDMSGTDTILANLRLRLILLGIGGALVAALVGWLLSRRSLRPVSDLTVAAAHVAETRDLAARIEVGRSDEIGQLAHSFNSMLAALEEARTSQQRLVADASHELRTPLTSLRTNIELLDRGGVADAERDEVLADITSELVELTHLVAELVDLATIGRHEEPQIEVDLAEVVRQAADRTSRRTGLDVTVSAEPTVVEGRPAGLLRAISNLLENAAKWGDGGPIGVTLTDGTVRVRDHGPGIAEEDLDRVFERFYRSPDARALPGSGLGLAIVAAVAEDHGGTVFAENASDGGAIVGFSVPTSSP